MEESGHPIVGDAAYAGDVHTHRMMLHAAKLKLPFYPNQPPLTISSNDPFSHAMDGIQAYTEMKTHF